MKTVQMSAPAVAALLIAADYYRDTLTECAYDHDHGDESACEGWGPTGLAELDEAIRALGKADR